VADPLGESFGSFEGVPSRDRPGGLRVDSDPSRVAAALTHDASPKGDSPRTELRTRWHTASVTKALAQPSPRGAGPESSVGGPVIRARLDYGQSSARPTELARRGFRST